MGVVEVVNVRRLALWEGLCFNVISAISSGFVEPHLSSEKVTSLLLNGKYKDAEWDKKNKRRPNHSMYNVLKVESPSPYYLRRIVWVIQAWVLLARGPKFPFVVAYCILVRHARTLAWRVIGTLEKKRRYLSDMRSGRMVIGSRRGLIHRFSPG